VWPDEEILDRGRRKLAVSPCCGPSVIDIALSASFFDAIALRMRRMKPFGLPYEGLKFLIPWSRVNQPVGRKGPGPSREPLPPSGLAFRAVERRVSSHASAQRRLGAESDKEGRFWERQR
jgi:hypothetical protein